MNTPVSRLGMRAPVGTGVGLAEPISGPNIGVDPVTVYSVAGFGGGIRSVGGVFRDPAASDVMSLLIEARTGTIEGLIDCAEKAGRGDVKACYILRSFIQRFSQLYYRNFDVLNTFRSNCDPTERDRLFRKALFERIDQDGFDALADYAVHSENAEERACEIIESVYGYLVDDAVDPDAALADWLEKNASMTLVHYRTSNNGEDVPTDVAPEFEAWVEKWNATNDTERNVSLDARFDHAMHTLFSEFVEVAKRDHMAYRVLGYLTTKHSMSYLPPRTDLNESAHLTPRAEARAKKIVDACIESGDCRRMVDLCSMVLYGDPSAGRVVAYFCEQSLATRGALNKIHAWLGRADSLFLRRDVNQAVIKSQHVHDAIHALARRGDQGAYELMEALAVVGDERSKTDIMWMSPQGAYPEGVESLAHFREAARSRQSDLPMLSYATMREIHDSVAVKIEEGERVQELAQWILNNLADDGAWLDGADARVILGNNYGVYLERLSELAVSIAEHGDKELIRKAMENFASTVRADIRELPAFITLVLYLPESEWLKALYDRFDSEALLSYMKCEMSNEPSAPFWVSTLAMWDSVPALEAVRMFKNVQDLELHVLRDFAIAGNELAKRALTEMEAECEDGEDAEVIPFEKPE